MNYELSLSLTFFEFILVSFVVPYSLSLIKQTAHSYLANYNLSCLFNSKLQELFMLYSRGVYSFY